jgi:hypothetical protein
MALNVVHFQGLHTCKTVSLIAIFRIYFSWRQVLDGSSEARRQDHPGLLRWTRGKKDRWASLLDSSVLWSLSARPETERGVVQLLMAVRKVPFFGRGITWGWGITWAMSFKKRGRGVDAGQEKNFP